MAVTSNNYVFAVFKNGIEEPGTRFSVSRIPAGLEFLQLNLQTTIEINLGDIITVRNVGVTVATISPGLGTVANSVNITKVGDIVP